MLADESDPMSGSRRSYQIDHTAIHVSASRDSAEILLNEQRLNLRPIQRPRYPVDLDSRVQLPAHRAMPETSHPVQEMHCHSVSYSCLPPCCLRISEPVFPILFISHSNQDPKCFVASSCIAVTHPSPCWMTFTVGRFTSRSHY